MNEQFQSEIMQMAIDIIRSHVESGEPLNENEVIVIALAQKTTEKKEDTLQVLLDKLPEVSKYLPLLTSFLK